MSIEGSTAVERGSRVLLTGATGYVGGRLGPRLLAAGYRVRCLVRSAAKLRARTWAEDPRVEVVEASLEDAPALEAALRGCDAAYYLIHSMEVAGDEYAERDRCLAEAFAGAAAAAGVGRIVYLGGLGEMGDGLSEHLGSRREVERVLAAGPVPVTILRAAVIIGSGSASFGILRYLVERLPVMITPKWVSTECQPIAIRDVLFYLVQCLQVPETAGQILDIGGPDVLSYRELIQVMAGELGLGRRLIVPVPVLTPRLSSLWIHLVTPISYRVARPLADGLRNRVVCRSDRATALMPHECLTAKAAVRAAVGQSSGGEVETAWSDAGVIPGDPDWAGGKMFID
ncbi:MAG: NAD(P)H-binding protein, partial [Phycisphaerae bacterium]|nr:NAD(P)H-binding protein [Phycisphaerae bacterium]